MTPRIEAAAAEMQKADRVANAAAFNLAEAEKMREACQIAYDESCVMLRNKERELVAAVREEVV